MFFCTQRIAADQSVVSGGVLGRLVGELVSGEKTEDVDAVVHRNDQHTALGEIFTVGARLGAAAVDEAAAENPYHDRQLRNIFSGRRPDIDGKAVFTRAGVEELYFEKAGLKAARTVFRRVANFFPGSGRLRRLPAKRSYGRSGERNAEEDVHFAVGGKFALHRAGFCFGGGSLLCLRERQER